jgi:thiol-disulfide isomerase/thioredoxin
LSNDFENKFSPNSPIPNLSQTFILKSFSNMKNSVFILTIISLAFASLRCDGDLGSGGLTLKGNLQNAGNMQVYLDKVGINPTSANQVVGKTDADGSGNFTISLPENHPEGLYRLRIGEQKMNLIFDGSERKVTVNGTLQGINQFQYDIGGSKGSVAYRNLMQRMVARQLQLGDLTSFVDTVSNPLAGMLVAVQTLGNNTHPQLMAIHEQAKKRLEQVYPSSSYGADYAAYLSSLQTAAVNPRSEGGELIAESERQPAPDIKLPNPQGKEYALSDLKGKVVLLDFWASWCGPCRRENPNVVKIYEKYKEKGFTVFSVSLDGMDSNQKAMLQNDPKQLNEMEKMQKERWKEAIAKDGLVWEYHVSDLKKWESAPARQYGVNGIPRTYLIDRNGNIAAVNLRGAEQIEETLLKVL